MHDDPLLDLLGVPPLQSARRNGKARHNGDLPAAPPAPKPSAPVLVRMSDVAPENVRWLWPDRIALGKLTLLAGDPGLGKSLLTIDLAARVSRGEPWPDDSRFAPPLGSVVLLSAEDDPADTIRPRLDAACADCSRVFVLEGIKGADDKGEWKRGINLSSDLMHLEAAIEEAGDCKLVIIDPISAYLGGADSHRNSDVRALLAPLAELAARYGVAVVVVTHLRKGEGAAMYRAMGSLAFIAAARAAWAISKDPADPARRLFLPVKMNLSADATGLAYRVIPSGGAVAVAWDAGAVTVTADEAMGRRDADRDATDEAADWLRHALADGPMASEELKRRARIDGMAWRTVERAKKPAGVVSAPDGYRGPWVWRLQSPPTESAKSP